MIARSASAVPSVRGLGAALAVPCAFISLGHLMLLVAGGDSLLAESFLTLVMIWPGLGLVFCPWAAGEVERRSGGDRRAVNMARILGLATYLLLALIYVFGVPFDDRYFFGGLDSGSGGLD